MLKFASFQRMFIALALLLFMWSASAQAQIGAPCNPQAAQTEINSSDSYRAYLAVKDLEGCFPIPTTTATGAVGGLGATGAFAFSPQTHLATASVRFLISRPATSTGPIQKPIGPMYGTRQITYPTLSVNGVNAVVSFQGVPGAATQVTVLNTPPINWSTMDCGVVSPTCNNLVGPLTSGNWTGTAAPGQPVNINVGPATAVFFTINSGGKSFTSYLAIPRPPVIGIGAFTVPALPLAILYAPPQEPQGGSTNSVTYQTTVKTTTMTSLQQENSTQQPNQYNTNYSTPANLFQTAMSLLNNAVPGASALGNVVAAANGTITGSTNQGASLTQSQSLATSDTLTQSDVTSPQSPGPGFGDHFKFLANVKVMWTYANGKIQLTLLSFDNQEKDGAYLLSIKDSPNLFDCYPANLPQAQQHCLTAQMARMLLALDPFTAPLLNVPNPTPASAGSLIPSSLTGSRFATLPEGCTVYDHGYTSGSNGQGTSHTVTQEDDTVQATTTTVVTDMTPGWMSYLAGINFPGLQGLGAATITQNQNTTAKTTNTVSGSTVVGQTVTPYVNFNLSETSPFVIGQCYDSLFGIFAYFAIPVTASEAASGTASPNALVTLHVGNLTYVTRADASGNYKFRAATIVPGSGTITINGIAKPIQITARPVATSSALAPR